MENPINRKDDKTTSKSESVKAKDIEQTGASKTPSQPIVAKDQLQQTVVKDALQGLVSGSEIGNLLQESIDIATEICSSKIKNSTLQIARQNLGYTGKKANKEGYALRKFLKDSLREWADNEIKDENDKYTDEKHKEIDASTSAEKEKEKEIFDKTQNIKNTKQRANLYGDLKKDVLMKIDEECEGIVKEVNSNFENDCNGIITKQLNGIYDESFKEFSKKKKDGSGDLAKISALSKVHSKAAGVGKDVYKDFEKSVERVATAKSESKLRELISELGVPVEDDKKTAAKTSPKDVKPEPKKVKSAEEMVYGSKLEKKKESLKTKVRDNEIVAPDINKGLKKFSEFIFKLVENPGDSISVEGGIKIPVHEGVYVTLGIGASVERAEEDEGGEDKYVTGKLNIEAGVSAGIANIAEIEAAIGGFIEIEGKNPQDFANLISYIMYRQARESHVFPHQWTNAMWGKSETSDKLKHDSAEAFGAESELALFGDKKSHNKGKIGVYGRVGASAHLGSLAGAEVEGKVSSSREYSRYAFEKSGQEKRLGQQEGYVPFGQKSKGQLVQNLEFEGSIEVKDIIGGAFSAELEIRNGKIKGWSVAVTGEIPSYCDLETTLIICINQALGHFKRGVKNEKAGKNMSAEVSEDISAISVGKSIASGILDFMSEHSVELKAEIEVDNESKEKNLNLELNSKASMETPEELEFVSFKLERSKRIFKKSIPL